VVAIAAIAALVIRAAGARWVAYRLTFAASFIFSTEFATCALVAALSHLLALTGFSAAWAVALTVLAMFDDDFFLSGGFGNC
jgi:hypothetical protein